MNHHITTSTDRKWVTDLALADRYSVTRATIWRWAREGRLPKPQKIGPNSSRWELGEADAAITGESS